MISGLTFDAASHIYRFDGQIVPSVTQVLRETGISQDFEAIGAISSELRAAIELKREIGTALHADAHAFDDNDLDWSTVDPRVEPYLKAWATFRENSGLTPLTRERLLFHPALRVAGTLDGIFLTPKDKRVLVDIKTGDPEDSGCQFQTAGYELLHVHAHPDQPIDERWGVQLIPGKQIPYTVSRYTDWQDAQKFRAFVVTYYAQAARRKAA